jgi:hypothetical protein
MKFTISSRKRLARDATETAACGAARKARIARCVSGLFHQ